VIRALALALLLAGCQVELPGGLFAPVQPERPVEFLVTVWTIRF
jgi:hypothetical protein